METHDTGRGYDCYFPRGSEDVYPLPDPRPSTGPVTQWIIVPDTLQHSPDLRSGGYAYGSICVHDGEPLPTRRSGPNLTDRKITRYGRIDLWTDPCLSRVTFFRYPDLTPYPLSAGLFLFGLPRVKRLDEIIA